jgi:Tfp pilus assembly protein PilF
MPHHTVASIVRYTAEWHTAGSPFPPVGGDERHSGPLTLAAVAERFVGHAADVVLPVATASPETVFAEVTTPVRSLATLVDQLEAGLLAAASRVERYERPQRRHAVVAGLRGAARLVAREADATFYDTVTGGASPEDSLPSPDAARASADRFAQWLDAVVDGEAHHTPHDARDAHVEAGEAALDAGEQRGALDAFRRAQLLDPDSAAAHLGLARCRADRMEMQRARQHYERGLDLAPDHERGNADYAVFRWLYDGEMAGIQQFETALERCPTSALVHRRAARMQFDNGHPRTALETLEGGIDRLDADSEGHRDLRIQRARLLGQMGEKSAAHDAVEALLATDAGDPEVHFVAAAVHDRFIEESATLHHLERAFEAQATAADVEESIARRFPSLLRLLTLLDETGRDEALLRWAEYALDSPAVQQRDGSITDRDVAEVEGYLRDRGIPLPGETAADDGESGDDDTGDGTADTDDGTGDTGADDPSVDEQVRTTVATDTEGVTDPHALVATGDKYRLCEAVRFARAYYERALESDETYVGAHRGLGRLAAEVGDPDETAIREHFERALAVDPTDRETRRRYGLALAWAGATDDAAEQYRSVLDAHPDDALTNCWYGDLCVDRGDHDLARQHLTRGLLAVSDTDEEVGASPRVYWTTRLVELLDDVGDDEAVVEWCRRGLALCSETLLPNDAQETLEEHLAAHVGDEATRVAPNRRDDSRDDRYWYAEVRGRECNALLALDGRDINWTTSGASFHMSVPVNEFTDPGTVTATVNVLRTVYDTTAGESVGAIDEATCSLRIKQYETGDVAAPETGTVLASADFDPAECDRLPTTIEATFERGGD